ncbi:MAG TPA: D-aminoacyl-tRNA deacylase [Fimbriimonadales bacterium]|nr:D-aminoacyl-tRNA deacylase [Fimbriimonadales bacterium]
MKAVVQRVRSASVNVDGRIVAEIGKGLLALIAVLKDDTEKDAVWMATKLAGLRVFDDEAGNINLSLTDVGGSLLLVSNFTIAGDLSRGLRPSFIEAASFEEGKRLFERCEQELRKYGIPVEVGIYGADMLIALENEGPVTLILDSKVRRCSQA